MFFILIEYEVGAKLAIRDRAQLAFTNSPIYFLSLFFVYFWCGMAYSIVNNRYQFFSLLLNAHTFTHCFSLILTHSLSLRLFVRPMEISGFWRQKKLYLQIQFHWNNGTWAALASVHINNFALQKSSDKQKTEFRNQHHRKISVATIFFAYLFHTLLKH